MHYVYDGLSRLTYACSDWEADTATCLGDSFRYDYDAVGNRLSELTASGTVTYTYDIANRLASVNGVSYTWDANGNLLDDGVNTYVYDHANRLTAVSGTELTADYRYNGLGDRVQQTVNGETTQYTLDLAAGLTQVLEDGTYTYLYGNGRTAQTGSEGNAYFLGDALGSVRQLVDGSGTVTLAQSYTPYGEILGRMGEEETRYAFTGEQYDLYSGLIYLRARYYTPQSGRFLTRDTWLGSDRIPASYNKWLYGYSNPLYYWDPSGLLPLTVVIDEVGNWDNADFDAIEAAAMDVARRLAATLNRDYLGYFTKCERRALPKSLSYPVSPVTAFLEVYGGPVTFTHVNYLCREECWGRSIGSQDIRIYKKAKVKGNPHFIVHELGHSFENALGDILGQDKQNKEQKPLRAILDTYQAQHSEFPNRKLKERCKEWKNGKCIEKEKYVPVDYYGFAGKNSKEINSWQQSSEVSAPEEFADMFIGWVYNQWESNPLKSSGRWSDDGQARADFMATNMPYWVQYAYMR